MKNLGQFIKATAVGGLIVIVPLAIVIFAIGSLLQTVMALGSKLEETYEGFGWLGDPMILTGVAFLLIVSLCFITGLLLITAPGKRISESINRFLTSNVPMYGMVQNLTAQFAGIKTDDAQPVMADLYGSDAWVLGFQVEELSDGKLAIFVPAIPVATVGQLYYVDPARVRRLDVKMMDVVNSITQWGVGSNVLFEQHHRGDSAKPEA